ncbi:uncharacterized protein LOC120253629 [Dioscorea cayenensis subsp. rotundata]|uniref:Uncharacterized protein LOC120253629 n=1 Tax=Dioscorea cayennensis subsp. rotundata TaxID=55577 RepID=A0AB40AS84_DIOCR|nr:uncharacterized protein LOC120253629 [Dioscorea cayenensis subsp. rotundata]
MDKSWMRKSRLSQEYEDGVEQFLNFAFANSSEDDRIICPCIKCRVPSPIHEPTNTFAAPSSSNPHFQTSRTRPDSLEELLRYAFSIHQVNNEGLPSTADEFNVEVNDGDEATIEVDEQPSKEVAKFYKLLEDMNNKLYEGSQHSRCEHLNDDNELVHKKPAKVLWYFPLIPRLQRLFMSTKTSADMIWHANGRTNDGLLRHPADAEAWKSFDARYPDFASDPRNVRLGLSSDWFNPFKLLSTSYNTWPVVLIPYNLPPWIGMKQTSFLLSVIIPGDKELKQLWVGVETYDASVRRNFNIRTALLWTINDFPAYANLSRWSTKGKYACPCCAAKTSSQWLTNGQKFCYMAHRLDLVDMGIRRELHPQYLPNGKTRLPPASFSMTKKEKDLFCQVLKTIKVPDAYSSNISKCVNQKERKLQSLKSHDYHILLHDLLPIALRSSMSKLVTRVISELCNIFKIICGKVLKVEDLDNLQYRAAIVLCHLEKIFPPAFFTIMVHLVIHLPMEAKIGGPVYYQWMYPIERFLLKLISYVRNKRYPEGSIAEGFLAEECVTFCSRYLVDVETIFDRPGRNLAQVQHELLAKSYLFESGGEPIGKVEVAQLDDISWAQAHHYVLFHYKAIESLQIEYRNILKDQTRCRRSNARYLDRKFTETFHEWLGETVSHGKNVSEEIKFLAQGPNRIVKRYKGLVINGFRFHTKA